MEPLFPQEVHDFFEKSSIPLAVFYSEDGRFYPYLISEGGCRMFEATTEEITARLNSDDPFSDMVEKEEMLEAIRNFSQNDVVYNVVYHEYVGRERKLLTIHATGEHEYTKDGRRYSIVRYDEISDRSRRSLFKDEEQAISQREKLFSEIDDALARSFTSVIYVNTEDLMVTPVRLNRHGRSIEDEANRDKHLRNVIDVYVKALVYRDDAKGVLRFGDYDYVTKRLEESIPVYHTYRTVREGKIVYYRLKIIPFDGGKKLIYGFEYFDDQMREELSRKTEHETQMTLLAGLTCEYESVWIVDSAMHHCKLVRSNMNPEISDIMNRDSEGSYEEILGNYIERYIVPEDKERVYSETSIHNLMRNTKEDEIFHINYYRVNPAGKKNYIQMCVSRVTDESGIVKFIYGFRIIDSIIEEEKTRNLLYSMAHIDSMTNVNNRRTFDEYMDSKDGREVPETLIFFSFDINNLKRTNDTLGHEAGDELIKAAADCMKEVLGKYGSIYRTGGDEFVAIINADEEGEEIIADLWARFDGWRGEYSEKLSISTGYVCARDNPGMSINDIRREAEKRMYDEKSKYYMQAGNDRRRDDRA